MLEALRILYRPVRAIQGILEEPDMKGPLLVLALLMAVTAATQVIVTSKIHLETPVLDTTPIPTSDLGPTPNITSGFRDPGEPRVLSVVAYNWTGTVTIHGANDTGDVEEELAVNETYEEYRTRSAFKSVANITFSDAGDGSSQFVTVGLPGEFNSVIAMGMLRQFIVSPLLGTLTNFFLGWVVYGGILLVVIKALRGEAGSLGALFTAVGCTFASLLVISLVYALLTLPLPTMRLPLRAWAAPGTEGRAHEEMSGLFQEKWYSTLPYRLGAYYLPYGVNLWIAALSIIMIHFSCGVSWRKAVVISAVASLANFFFRFYVI